MNIHKNARLTPKGREILVRRIVNGGLRVEEAAGSYGEMRTIHCLHKEATRWPAHTEKCERSAACTNR